MAVVAMEYLYLILVLMLMCLLVLSCRWGIGSPLLFLCAIANLFFPHNTKRKD